MILKYKNTIYEPIFEVTDNVDGLGNNDFWININFRLKNEDIDFDGVIPGMSFNELKYWNEKNKEFVSGKMTSNETVSFIRNLGKLIYYPKKSIVEKRLFLYDDVKKYYSVFIEKDELEEIIRLNEEFIKSVDKTGILD